MVGRPEEQDLRHLAERDKREYTSRSIAGSSVDGASLLSDGGGQRISTASAVLSESNRGRGGGDGMSTVERPNAAASRLEDVSAYTHLRHQAV